MSLDFSIVTFKTLREVRFRGAEQNYEKVKQKYTDAFSSLGTFQNAVDAAGSVLQQGGKGALGEVALLKTALTYVVQYEGFWAIALEAQVFALAFLAEINGLEIQPYPHLDMTLLNQFHPELKEAIEVADKVAKENIAQLKNHHIEVDTLQSKMTKQLKEITGWSVQRYCQIAVDNKGVPLTKIQRAWNNCAAIFVPSSESLVEKLKGLQESESSGVPAAALQ